MSDFPIKKNVARTLYIPGLVSQSDTKLFKTNPTIAAGDFKYSLDGGDWTNLATLPDVYPAGGTQVRIQLAQAELNANQLNIRWSDAAGAEWCDGSMMILTGLAQMSELDTQLAGAKTLSPLMLAMTYLGASGSDAWSTMRNLGGSIVLAGKRTAVGTQYIYRSTDDGIVFASCGAISGATGSNAYGLGQNGAVVLCGTGDVGSACILRSPDYGVTWSVTLSSANLNTLVGGSVLSVFRCLYMGSSRWLVALKNSASAVYMLESLDNGLTFHIWTPTGLASSLRDMFLTSDGSVVAIAFVQQTGLWVSNDTGSSFTQKLTDPSFTGFCELSAGVWLSGTYASGSSPTSPAIWKTSNSGGSWKRVHLFTAYSTVGYVRSIIKFGNVLLAFVSGWESSITRCAIGAISYDQGETWVEFGNPFYGPFGGLHGIYEAVIATDGSLLLATQPDSAILRGGLSHIENIKAKTDNLPTDPADQSAVEAAITAAVSPLATTAALAAVAGYVDTEVAAIKARTDNLPSDPADESLLEAAIETLRVANAAVIGTTVADGEITIRNYAQASIALTGLPDFTGYTEIVLVGKRRQSDPDSAALFYLSSLTGLVYLNGAAATPSDGSLTVVSSTAITGTIKASAMANLVAMDSVFCGAKARIGGDWISEAEYALHIESATPKVVT